MNARMLVATAAGLLLAAAVNASEFDDFRIPDHHWRHGTLGFEGRLAGQDFGDPDLETRNASRIGILSGSADWYRDSESRQHRFTLAGRLAGLGGTSDLARFTDLSEFTTGTWYRYENQESEDRVTEESAELIAEWREYPWSAPWGFSVTLDAAGAWRQHWSNRESDLQDVVDGAITRALEEAATDGQRHDYRVDGSLGAGYGRVRDATGVESARLLLDRLRADGKLARDPSPEAARKLASLFYVEPAFSAPHDFPGRFFWREVERVLREDGVIGEAGLDAFEVLHALEPLVVAGGRFHRAAGWFVGPVATFRHLHRGGRDALRSNARYYIGDSLAFEGASESTASFDLGDDAVLAGGIVEYHRAFGPRTQFDIASIAQCDVEDPELETTWRSGVSAGYLVDERWFAWLKGNHALTLFDRDRGTDRRVSVAGVGLRYYLEDHWSVALEYLHLQSETGGSSTAGDTFQRNQAVLFGVRWERGTADAPGLVDPVRPLP